LINPKIKLILIILLHFVVIYTIWGYIEIAL